ncbi:MAG: DNA mismatch repair protein MutT, partial [Methylomarinum sp.]|nr:DNA mismatch repair protein MutT [Methylomarinum sp.]
TQTHPDTKPLGWDNFKVLTASVNLPVYALGGLSQAEKPMAKVLGAQGIAGISTFLKKHKF